VDDIATNQTLTHLTNITGFLREIAAELKAINRREAAREAKRSPKSVIRSPKSARS
jgi:hypothetical protein